MGVRPGRSNAQTANKVAGGVELGLGLRKDVADAHRQRAYAVLGPGAGSAQRGGGLARPARPRAAGQDFGLHGEDYTVFQFG